MTGARVLILDEPTQGVDVGYKLEIHALIMDLAEQGAAILMISSELPEVIGMSDRIAVMHDGTLAGALGHRSDRASGTAMAPVIDMNAASVPADPRADAASPACWRSSRPVISRAPT